MQDILNLVQLEPLLHPAQAFADPQDVVDDACLSLSEKRAILASWASDACAVEAAPGLRRAPGSASAVCVDDILEALRKLDHLADARSASWERRQVRRASIEAFRERRRRWTRQVASVAELGDVTAASPREIRLRRHWRALQSSANQRAGRAA
jgi:hypothetical protein